jgi:plasmid replication initiation protein
MALLPDRHPQEDMFILDISDVVPKDDTASMEHPLFSLATKPDMRVLTYGNGDSELRIEPSGRGLPTIFDKDILIFCISQLMHRKNRGEKIGKRVRFSARELSIATNRPIGGNHYKRLEAAFHRLRGTNFQTNIRTGKLVEKRIFGMIDEGGFVIQSDGSMKLDYCEVVLSDWLMRAIEAHEVLTLHADYFRIRSPLERRIYEICRKHCGKQPQWQISLEKLQNKTGSNAPARRFKYNMQKIIKEDETPEYRLSLNIYDLVTVTPRQTTKKILDLIKEHDIPEDAEEMARYIAQEKGFDYYALKSDWLTYANEQVASGKAVRNIGKAFVGWCKNKESLR